MLIEITIRIDGREEGIVKRMTSLRHDVGRERTRSLNRLKAILRRHNLEQECPTKGIQTQRARKWMDRLPLSAIERVELNHELTRQHLLARQLKRLQGRFFGVTKRTPGPPCPDAHSSLLKKGTVPFQKVNSP
jgi:hypothetical protein